LERVRSTGVGTPCAPPVFLMEAHAIPACQFCSEIPPAPWIYCQKDDCQRASLGRILREVREIRAQRESAAEKKDATPVLLKTQKQAQCPLCKESVDTASRCSSCANCQTTYHNDCLLELTGSRCSTIGCNKFVATQAGPERRRGVEFG